MDRYYGNEWGRKGATISDKTARLEYGLTQDEIYNAIDAGNLQYRPAAMHGNPWLRLLRREVEDLARTLHGDRDVREKCLRLRRNLLTRRGHDPSAYGRSYRDGMGSRVISGRSWPDVEDGHGLIVKSVPDAVGTAAG